MTIICIASWKGGVGTITTAIQLATCPQTLAPTLLVDGDPWRTGAATAPAAALAQRHSAVPAKPSQIPLSNPSRAAVRLPSTRPATHEDYPAPVAIRVAMSIAAYSSKGGFRVLVPAVTRLPAYRDVCDRRRSSVFNQRSALPLPLARRPGAKQRQRYRRTRTLRLYGGSMRITGLGECSERLKCAISRTDLHQRFHRQTRAGQAILHPIE